MTKDNILVLKATKYSEADLIVTGLTRTGAKQSFFARSALRSKKRFGGGVLQPTHFIEVMFKERSSMGGDGKLYTLHEAHLLEGFEGIRTSYSKIQLALYFLKLVTVVAREDDLDSAALFNLIGNALKLLQIETDLNKLRVHFELKLLSSQGVLESRPEWRDLNTTALQSRSALAIDDEHWKKLEQAANRRLGQFFQEIGVKPVSI